MKRLILSISIILLVIVCVGYTGITAQEVSRESMENTAIEAFEHGDYRTAINAFEQLCSIYATEPLYNYYLGRAYIELNTKLDKAIHCLRLVASKNYNNNVHLYLGIAYLKQYRFDDAEISFVNFRNLATKKEIKHFELDYWESALKACREETYMALKINVVAKETVFNKQPGILLSEYVNGNIISKPEVFGSEYDTEQLLPDLMFLPDSTEPGDLLYFSSQTRNSKKGLDIFFVKQVTAIEYSIPKALLGDVNSTYNESCPYFDEQSATLYFSSDRIGGMGGYDIYKSKYDAQNKTFLTPEKLGFPYNSVNDDYMYVIGKDNESALFISNRNMAIDEGCVFKVKSTNANDYVFPKEYNQLIELAALKVQDKPVVQLGQPVVEENINPFTPPIIRTPYELAIEQALKTQLSCDSLQYLIISKKNILRVTKDSDNRRILIAEITAMENTHQQKQQKADKLFAEAEAFAQPDEVAAPVNDGLAINFDTTIIEKSEKVNDIHVFRFKSTLVTPVGDVAENTEVEVTELQLLSEPAKEFEFSILNASPYSAQMPIPIENEIKEGLVYRIQLGAFSKEPDIGAFGGLSPLSLERLRERSITKIYVGYFFKSKDAKNALTQVKDYGYQDAFIVPYLDNMKISIQKARELEFAQQK